MSEEPDLSIRDAIPADAEALVAILNPIIEARTYTALDTPFGVDAERDYVVNFPPRGATFEVARQKGYEKIFTFVRADNPAALATYVAHGFGVIGTARQHAKIDGRYVDEILIERTLEE